MRPGPKSKDVTAKKISGTYRPSRDGARTPAAPVSGLPVMPDYLTPAAQAVWNEEISRLVNSGTGEPDSSLFARYCAAEALARETFKTGGLPAATLLAELRRTAEMLGLGGASSRQNRANPNAPGATTNRFADLARQ